MHRTHTHTGGGSVAAHTQQKAKNHDNKNNATQNCNNTLLAFQFEMFRLLVYLHPSPVVSNVLLGPSIHLPYSHRSSSVSITHPSALCQIYAFSLLIWNVYGSQSFRLRMKWMCSKCSQLFQVLRRYEFHFFSLIFLIIPFKENDFLLL